MMSVQRLAWHIGLTYSPSLRAIDGHGYSRLGRIWRDIDKQPQTRPDRQISTEQVQLAFAALMVATHGVRAGTPPYEVVLDYPDAYSHFLWALRAASIITHDEG